MLPYLALYAFVMSFHVAITGHMPARFLHMTPNEPTRPAD